MPIIRDLVLTVNNNTASLNEPVHLYRGDRGIELHIKIQKFRYRFGGKKSLENMVDDNIVGARALIMGPGHEPHDGKNPTAVQRDDGNPGEIIPEGQPFGTCFEVSAKNIDKNTIIIDINEEWIDQIHETGDHTIQIQLYGNKDAKTGKHDRITIPPVTFHVEELLCDYPENFIELGDVDESDEEEKYGWDASTKTYVPYEFIVGEVIPYDALNGMESAIEYSTEKLKDVDTELDEKVDEVIASLNQYKEQASEAINGVLENSKSYSDGIVAKEKENREKADDVLDGKIDKEVSDRKTADNTLEGKITKEVSDRISADTALKTALLNKIDVEVNARKAEDSNLHTKINKEISDRRDAITNLQATLQGKIDGETSARKSADSDLQSKINKEITDRASAINALRKESQDDLSSVNGTLRSSINAEIKNRQDADSDIRSNISEVRASIIKNKDEASTALRGLRTELIGKINTETNNRQAADGTLQDVLSTEIKSRQSVDLDLTRQIAKNAAAISAEESERKGAISLLDAEHSLRINELKSTIDGEIKVSINELEEEINTDYYRKEEVYNKEEFNKRFEWMEKNILGPLTYKGELESVDQIANIVNPECGDAYIIGQEVHAFNGESWDSTDIKGPKGDKGDSIDIVMSETAPEDKDFLWIVNSTQEEYATRGYVQDYTSNTVRSNTAKRVEFVTEYPATLESGVLYILVEEDYL